MDDFMTDMHMAGFVNLHVYGLMGRYVHGCVD